MTAAFSDKTPDFRRPPNGGWRYVRCGNKGLVTVRPL
jgi:hypothetical protein